MASAFFKEQWQNASKATMALEFTSLFTHFFLQVAFTKDKTGGSAQTISAICIAAGVGNLYTTYLATKMKNQTGSEYTALPYGIDFVSSALFTLSGKGGCMGVMMVGVFKILFGLLFSKKKPLSDAMLKHTPTLAYTLPIGTWSFVKILGTFGMAKLVDETPLAGIPILMILLAVHYGGVRVIKKFSIPDLHWIIPALIAAYLYKCPPIINKGYKFKWDIFDGGIGDFIDGFKKSQTGTILISNSWASIAMAALASTLVTFASLVHAQKEGDAFPIKETLVADGAINILGGALGAPILTSVQFGQPVHKKLGAKTCYTFVHGMLYLILGATGLWPFITDTTNDLIYAPNLVLFGIMLFQSTFVDEFKALPERYNPVLVVVLMLFTGGTKLGFDKYEMTFIYAPVWIPILMHTIDRKWKTASSFAFVGAVLSFFCIYHQGVSSIFKDFKASPWKKATKWDPKTGFLQVTVAYVILGFFYRVLDKQAKSSDSAPPEVDGKGPKMYIGGLDQWSEEAKKNSATVAPTPHSTSVSG